MIIISAIFFIAIITAFGMLTFRAWQIRTSRVTLSLESKSPMPKMSFRQMEKIMLYLTKHVVQGLVLVVVKYWFITTTKTKKWLGDNWPKVHSYFHKKEELPTVVKPSFVSRAILESKAKIKRIKENVKKQHEEQELSDNKE